MIKFKAKAAIIGKKVVVNGVPCVEKAVIYDGEEKNLSAIYEAEKAIRSYIHQKVWQFRNNPPQPPISRVPGEKGEILIALSWECTGNERAKPRPKAVIAAEKAAKAAKVAAKQARDVKWEEQHRIELANFRQRVSNQVSHAFALGKHGTEPAGKYITCGHCNAPAAFLGLGMKLSGAAVIDEDQIVGATCQPHDTQWHTNGWVEKIPCSRLEFFFDGVRSIAVKVEKP